MQMVVAMFACVTSGLTTPGVRARSAWYGPLLVELGDLKYATASSRTAPARNSMRIDMRRGCVPFVPCASCPTWTRPNGFVKRAYSSDEIDALAAYCREL